MNLYAGKILVVDLSNQRIEVEPLNEEFARQYWGGWGLALRYYCEHSFPEVDPLSADNPLVIMTGPFCGTLAPMTSRFCVVSKSPHTGTVFESNAGGAFGPELKFAGYDGILIKGKAPSLVYLEILDDQVHLKSAEYLAAKGIFETEQLLKKASGSFEAKAMAIGPAGENAVPFACVGTEAYRQFGRAGVGALFGSKNLKGIACRGTGGIRVADLPAFLDKADHYKKKDLLTDDNLWAGTDGTPVLVDMTNELGLHPTRNFTRGVNDQKESLNSTAIQKAKISDRACASCPMACGKFTSLNGAQVEGPEYETLCLGGSNCEINDLEQVIRFNRLCDDLGLDTISSGNTIGLAMEMTESGIHDFGLRFGHAAPYLEVIPEIAILSTDRGRDLALGAAALAEKYGHPGMAAHVKGLEFPAYDPRGNYGMGLAYATSERGACHLRAFTVFAEDPFDIPSLAQEVVEGQNLAAIKFSMCFCDFWGTVTPEVMADLLSAGLGKTIGAEELAKAGERIWNLCRLFNIRAGFDSAQDTLPGKIMSQGLEDGPHAGRTFGREDFEAGLEAYYRLRGWHPDGMPTRNKLVELGLEGL